jgi:FkbM family methyltransferase
MTRGLTDEDTGATPLELRLMLALTHRLPRIRGAGRLAQTLARIYTRQPRAPVIASIRASRMRLDPSEFVDRALLFYPQFWDPVEMRFLEHTLKPGDVFFDIGAHLGFYSLAASKLVGPDGRVVAIEADPRTYAGLVFNVGLNQAENIRAINVGVADVAQELRLSSPEGNRAGNSFLLDEAEGVRVMCRPLADIVNEAGVKHITGAKLDIEGFEFRVIEAYLRSVSDTRLWPEFLIVEFHPSWVSRSGGDVIALLRDHGYATYRRNVYGEDYENHIVLRSPRA